jgi:hypothetical protein
MIRIYYHIYAIEGVESIINEQLTLIKKHINQPYSLTIGISVSENNNSVDDIIKLIYEYDSKIIIGDTKLMNNEFVTLNLIEKDKSSFNNNDYIFYLHTKGASKQTDSESIRWRNVMQLHNIQYIDNVFGILDNEVFNTYGFLLEVVSNPTNIMYSGNFWWMTGQYAKTIDISNVDITNRCNAELQYIQMGVNWKPYSIIRKGDNWKPYSELITKSKLI